MHIVRLSLSTLQVPPPAILYGTFGEHVPKLCMLLLYGFLPVQKPLLRNMGPTCQALLEPYSPFTKCLGAPGKGSKQRGFNFKSLQSCNLAMLRGVRKISKNGIIMNHRLRVFLAWNTDTRSKALDVQCWLIVKPLSNGEAKE